MMKKCSNGRSLLVTDIDSVEKQLDRDWTPYVVLLTAWSSYQEPNEVLGTLVKFLLAKGARVFVCVGSHSEQLHDEIDSIFYEYGDEVQNAKTAILTTYHDDESIEEAVNYFVHGTDLPDDSNGGLLAILGSGDLQVRAALSET
ncbi:DUF7684 family protein [Gilvimarinus sp. F26214L]|uniref:DUF7684 family protein n=1 Tax=Gilvimarinus sp. DZF01 TaxID=3461371 RepID=UPI004045F9FE